MTNDNTRARLNEQILAEACDWFIDCHEGELDTAGRERFNQWLRRSPEHVQAYLEIVATWEDSAKLNGERPLDLSRLIAEAQAESNIVSLAATSYQDSRSYQDSGRRGWGGWLPWLLFAAAASVLLAIGTVFLRQPEVYTTGIGEQRSLVLDDGSTVELNARSRLRVRFSHAGRLVDLIAGQALFRVKKDAARPFIVVTEGTRVRAVGTQFDVYRKATGTIVTVIEGRVAVSQLAAPTVGSTEAGDTAAAVAPILLSPGEQLAVIPGTVPRPAQVDIASAIAWTQRRLVFDETPLADAAGEFNRYNTRQMIIDDPSLADYHIRGNFEANDPDRLVQFLRDRFDVDVNERGNEIRISR